MNRIKPPVMAAMLVALAAVWGLPANMEDVPFDVFEFMEYELPWEMRSDPDLGR